MNDKKTRVDIGKAARIRIGLSKVLSEFHNEEDFTKRVVMPFISRVHPGTIEYTHSSRERGRDLVSFGKDSALERRHVLCVQVKAQPISSGASSFEHMAAQARHARKNGVTFDDGGKALPDEVWIVCAHPFSEEKRNMVDGSIQEFHLLNIKLVAGDELCRLLTEKTPDLAEELIKKAFVKTANELEAFLIEHRESRAFLLGWDRNIEEFYIPATLCPNAKYVLQVLENGLTIKDFYEKVIVPCDDLRTYKEIIARAKHIWEEKHQIYLKSYRVNLSGVCDLTPEKTTQYLANPEEDEKKISCSVKIGLADEFQSEKTILNKLLRKCPAELTENNVHDVKALCVHVQRMEQFISYCAEHFQNDENDGKASSPEVSKKDKESLESVMDYWLDRPANGEEESFAEEEDNEDGSVLDDDADGLIETNNGENQEIGNLARIRLPTPENILQFANIALIEGMPGCGKTTLLKKLGRELLKQKKELWYVRCCSVGHEFKRKQLHDIIKTIGITCSRRSIPGKHSIIILDGLDEASFDLAKHIIKDASKYSKIIASSRTAYETALIQAECFRIGLALFTPDERNMFFQKFFQNEPDLLSQAQELIKKYSDIDFHTRLPLIATIVVGLVSKGFHPTKKAEIYDMRLDLLLLEWDTVKGVSRIQIRDNEPKKRFLEFLAYKVHSFDGRCRMFDEHVIEDVYEAALGNRAHELDYEKMMRDLVVASGILVRERKGVYSFGHLSFQEHLAGRYIKEWLNVKDIYDLLGDDWWREPLNFYASLKGDITDLAQYMQEQGGISEQRYLKEMIKYAPYTSRGAIDTLEK